MKTLMKFMKIWNMSYAIYDHMDNMSEMIPYE